jgi:predicted protein tyrosine phosphatase
MAKIMIASRDEAVDILRNPKYNEGVSAIVSISEAHKSCPSEVEKARKDKVVLTLHFDDLDNDCIEKLGKDQSGYQPPTEKDIIPLLQNADAILNSGGLILVHCAAGVSRSAAAAFILKCLDLGKGHEAEALEYLLKGRSYIYPNDLMVDIAQELLGPGWRMSEVIRNFRANRPLATTLDDNVEQLLQKGKIVRI